MAVQLSVAARNAQLDALETAIGTAPLLRFYSGAMPGSCATAASGTLLVEMTLPADWMAAASAGTKALQGTWLGVGLAPLNAGYFRIYDAAGTTCHMQGTITATGGGGDLTLTAIAITTGQPVSVATFLETGGNA